LTNRIVAAQECDATEVECERNAGTKKINSAGGKSSERERER